MPCPELQPGLTFRRSIVVNESLTGPGLSGIFGGLAEMPPVFSTAFLVGLVDWTCIEGLRTYLLEGEHTLGTLIDLSHVAATPVGIRITAEARLLAVVERKLRFRIVCHDEHEFVGDGTHERMLIDSSSLMDMVEAKRMAAAPRAD